MQDKPMQSERAMPHWREILWGQAPTRNYERLIRMSERWLSRQPCKEFFIAMEMKIDELMIFVVA
jgi:hypothetical protein